MAARGVIVCLQKSNPKYFHRSYCSVRNELQKEQHRSKSTTASVVASADDVEGVKYQKDVLDLTFENTKDAYKSKTTWELIRALMVLKLSTYDYLVENNQKLLKLGKKILGPSLFHYLMRQTFYGHFVAGQDEQEILPTIQRMQSFGVKSILDYSAEEDLSEEQAREAEMSGCRSSASEDGKLGELKQYQPYEEFADRRKYCPVARTYFYLDEAQCEKNMETFLKCISAVAGSTQCTGFAAIKMTALGRPQLLMQLSEVIAQTRKFFSSVTGKQARMALENVSPEFLEHKLEDFHFNVEKKEVREFLQHMDYDKKGLMNLYCWSGLVDMDYVISDLFKVPNLKTGTMEPIISALTEEEEEMFRNMMRRLHHIAKVAREKDVRVMIDAEQSYFQPAISRITMELMRKYNKEKAIIFNTYQCYLKEAFNNVVLDLELADRQDFYFGAKLVRGAYMEQERFRAKQIGYEDPINPTYEATSEMYHKILTQVLHRVVRKGDRKTAVMVATHNEDTVRFTVQKMEEMGIKPEHKVICFGQLYGMCDHVSFPLGQSGYSVYKYVPYGPIDEVLPYLSRRAQENHCLLKKSERERKLMRKEIFRRLLAGQVVHKPEGNYRPI
ncbi:proline dehydrogenase 1, mitochondrial-like isoform X1 [Argiope bruennichi]|uniref:Proline dehydrogenase n=1 Tax=Argiope bruennichi TaxID=94029 RepID=A0A8T0FE73_ARGBR|nr:proline dehydrogenase 1, mitochondrial-like isoform X1 [Argiope bruennichi]KAF8788695.1 Proline dehydrogenase 1 like protein [Argiope bruennichi]